MVFRAKVSDRGPDLHSRQQAGGQASPIMPLKPCCAMGSLHAGTPTGREDKIYGLDCYIAEGPSSKGIIVIIPDAFGWTLPNNRILADEYAKRGFTVYLPEVMDGVKVPDELMESMDFITKATGLYNQAAKIRHVAYVMYHILPWM